MHCCDVYMLCVARACPVMIVMMLRCGVAFCDVCAAVVVDACALLCVVFVVLMRSVSIWVYRCLVL